MYILVEKDAVENFKLDVDWSEWLNSDTITASTWSVPAGITLSSDQRTATTTTARLTGGTRGENYYITNTITTAVGRITIRTFSVKIISR